MNQSKVYINGQQIGAGSYSSPSVYKQLGPIVQGGSSSSSSSSNEKNRRKYDQYGGQGGPGPYNYSYDTPKEHDHSCLKACCLGIAGIVCCCCVANAIN